MTTPATPTTSAARVRSPHGVRLAAGVATLLAALAAPALAQPAQTPSLLLVHFMPWFQTPDVTGFWGPHWTGFNNEADPTTLAPDGLPDIWSNYDPLIGLYDSSDPDVLECQLLQMKLAGIDGVIVDWYGTSSAFDYPFNQAGSIALFNRTADLGMQFAVCYEDRTIEARINAGLLPPQNAQAALEADLGFLQNNWFGAPHYVRKDGRPLLLNFGPIFFQSPTPWNDAFTTLSEDPYFFALSNLWTTANADGAFTWFSFSAWDGTNDSNIIKQRLNTIYNGPSTNPDLVIPSAVAGFNDDYDNMTFPFLDHRGGQTLRESLQVSIEGDWPIIQIATWNDYTEGTMIEPTVQFGYTFLEVIQEERAQEIGPSFTFTADDLRLPERLLDLRRSGAVPDAELDQIAQLLVNGDVDQARIELALAAGALFTQQPADVIVNAGGMITFSITLNAAPPDAVYQWTRDGVPLTDSPRISGAGADTLIITQAAADDAGAYAATVTIAGIDATSEPAVAAVRPSARFGDVNGDDALNILDLLDMIDQLDQ